MLAEGGGDKASDLMLMGSALDAINGLHVLDRCCFEQLGKFFEHR